uniref:Uncharacterized protein n=1 Tax=Macaca mulatta TaxID=9544 RepID=A0A5F8ABQ2_MACMU
FHTRWRKHNAWRWGCSANRWGWSPQSWWVLCWGSSNAVLCGVITCWDGSSTSGTGPANLAGAWEIDTPADTPLPAALITPGPPAAPASGTRAMPVSWWGSPSTVTDTKFSPCSNTRPQKCFSLSSGCFTFFGLIFLNSSQSQRIKFTCLSNALKAPKKILPSCRMHFIL